MKIVKVSAPAEDRTEVYLPFNLTIWFCNGWNMFHKKRDSWRGYYVTIYKRTRISRRKRRKAQLKLRQAACNCDIMLLAFVGALYRFIFKAHVYWREEE